VINVLERNWGNALGMEKIKKRLLTETLSFALINDKYASNAMFSAAVTSGPGGAYSQKLDEGVQSTFKNPYIIRTNSAILPTLFETRALNQYPVACVPKN